MKKFYQVIVLFLVFVAIVNLPVSVCAVFNFDSQDAGGSCSTYSNYFESCLYDGAGNTYSTRTFYSLESAKQYYGYDFTYTPCSVFYNNKLYTHYYTFSNSTKCYITVLE